MQQEIEEKQQEIETFSVLPKLIAMIAYGKIDPRVVNWNSCVAVGAAVFDWSAMPNLIGC